MSYIMKDLRKHGFSTDNRVYVIAELGINHGGDLATARKLINSASKTGVNAVKFQTYITEKRVPKDSPIFDILKKCELPFSAFKELKDYSEKQGVEFLSTPFDDESVDFLESINCNMHKVASFDVVNQKFLSKVADTKKTIIMSVGMSNIEEIRKAFEIIKAKTEKIGLLHCISAYPTKEEDANLSAICRLKEEFDCVIGQSDHTNDILVSLYAVACGAQIIEKHFMVDENFQCVDRPISITEKKTKELVSKIRRLEKILGQGLVGVTKPQEPILAYRRYSDF